MSSKEAILLMLSSFNTASGRYYCNAPKISRIFGSLATFQYRKRQVLLQFRQNMRSLLKTVFTSFNTASGRYYCNLPKMLEKHVQAWKVSIPQAVGTIAIRTSKVTLPPLLACFNTASGRYYCNVKVCDCEVPGNKTQFQYRKRQVLLQWSRIYQSYRNRL